MSENWRKNERCYTWQYPIRRAYVYRPHSCRAVNPVNELNRLQAEVERLRKDRDWWKAKKETPAREDRGS